MVNLSRRSLLACGAALAAVSAQAQSDSVKIGLILPRTGQQASPGRQIDAAVKLWQAQNGTKAGGKTVEIVVLDDDLDGLAAGLGAVLRLPQLDRGIDLPPGGRLLPGPRQDQADLHAVGLRLRRHSRESCAACQQAASREVHHG